MPAEQKSELAFLPLQAARSVQPGVPDDSNNFVGDENIVNINSNINDEDDSNINFEDDNNINHFSDDNNNQDATTKMFLINIIMMKLTITSMMKMTTR